MEVIRGPPTQFTFVGVFANADATLQVLPLRNDLIISTLGVDGVIDILEGVGAGFPSVDGTVASPEPWDPSGGSDPAAERDLHRDRIRRSLIDLGCTMDGSQHCVVATWEGNTYPKGGPGGATAAASDLHRTLCHRGRPTKPTSETCCSSGWSSAAASAASTPTSSPSTSTTAATSSPWCASSTGADAAGLAAGHPRQRVRERPERCQPSSALALAAAYSSSLMLPASWSSASWES